MAKICVFSSSADKLSGDFIKASKELGSLMGEFGHELVYGGTHRGLMGEVSKSFAKHSDKITEIIPKIFEGLAIKNAKIIVTENFGERLRKMEANAEAFIALPGGIGTVYEIMDVIQHKQLKLHEKPLAIININNIFNPLKEQIENLIKEGLVPEDNLKLIKFVNTPKEALEFIEEYSPPEIKDKLEPITMPKEKPKVGVGVLIKKDDRILFGRRINSHGNLTWSFPGGHLEHRETIEECAAREVFEETGLKINDIEFLTATNDIFENEKKHYITLFVTARTSSDDPKIMEPNKCEEWRWFEPTSLPKPLFLPIENLLKKGIKI